MRNITINIPDNYEKNLQWLKRKKIIASRSEGVRNALSEFLEKELIRIKLLRFGEGFENSNR